MTTDDTSIQMSSNLATNLRALRAIAGVTQAQLARRAEVPRSTIANLEAGGGNPTLRVLVRLAGALRVSIEELLSTPHAQCRVFPVGSLPVERRRGGVRVAKLLPDPIPGMEIDRFELPPGTRMPGVPHRAGTREYLFCERGALILWAGGERYALTQGDVATFLGDQRHSYGNDADRLAVAFSVVAFVPLTTH